jgi:hypothetical protein
MMPKYFFLAIAALLFTLNSSAQLSLTKTWLNQEKDGKVRVFLGTDGKYHGQIVWLKEPNENGAPKLDKENPDSEKRKKASFESSDFAWFREKIRNRICER